MPHGFWDLSSQTRVWTRGLQYKHQVLTTGCQGSPRHVCFVAGSTLSSHQLLLPGRQFGAQRWGDAFGWVLPLHPVYPKKSQVVSTQVPLQEYLAGNKFSSLYPAIFQVPEGLVTSWDRMPRTPKKPRLWTDLSHPDSTCDSWKCLSWGTDFTGRAGGELCHLLSLTTSLAEELSH